MASEEHEARNARKLRNPFGLTPTRSIAGKIAVKAANTMIGVVAGIATALAACLIIPAATAAPAATAPINDADNDVSASCLFTPVDNEDDLRNVLADAQDGDIVDLCADVELTKPLTLPAKKLTIGLWSFTLETNGNTITVPSGATTTIKSTTKTIGTVRNSAAATSTTDQHTMFNVAEGGKLTISSGDYATASSQIITGSGTVTVNGGAFSSTATAAQLQYSSGKAVFTISGPNASLAFNKGTLTADTIDLDKGYALYGVYAANGAGITLGTANGTTGPSITSGYAAVGFNNTTSAPAITLTVNGGTYKAGLPGVNIRFNSVFYLSGASRVTVNGGTFSGADSTTTSVFALPYRNAGVTLAVNGGDYSDAKAVIASYAATGSSQSGANALGVTGGTFRSPIAAFESGATFTGYVTGGTFTTEPDADAAADGYAFSRNDDGTFGVTAASNWLDIAPYRASSGYTAPEAPEGQVFTGWFTDSDFSTPLGESVTTGHAYARFTPVSDVIEFRGGSLRIDDAATTTKTPLRFGYRMPKSLGLTSGAVTWTYVIGGRTYTAKAVNPYDDGEHIVNNIVFTGVPVASYATDIAVTTAWTFTTADGTAVTATETAANTRSVRQVATAVLADDTAGETVKTYARGLLDAMGE